PRATPFPYTTLFRSDQRGPELVEQLIEHCDVVVENFSPRVFDNFGLTAERLKELNPRLVFARMPAFRLDGPWRDNIGFAQTMERSEEHTSELQSREN